MKARKTYVAGSFYPDNETEVKSQIDKMMKNKIDESITVNYGGIVPHAGWMYSGSTAMKVYSSIKDSSENSKKEIDTFVILGAVHVMDVIGATMYHEGSWNTPLGEIEIDDQLSRLVYDETDVIVNTNSHILEHSIEVQVPMIKYLFPRSKILPIMCPPIKQMKEFGKSLGKIIKKSEKNVMIIASTDLTHYGPRFGITCGGYGQDGLNWMKKNDQRIMKIMLDMEADKVIEETQSRQNACGGGAILTSLATFSELGAKKGSLLGYTTSYDERPHGEPSESVGYAAIVY